MATFCTGCSLDNRIIPTISTRVWAPMPWAAGCGRDGRESQTASRPTYIRLISRLRPIQQSKPHIRSTAYAALAGGPWGGAGDLGDHVTMDAMLSRWVPTGKFPNVFWQTNSRFECLAYHLFFSGMCARRNKCAWSNGGNTHKDGSLLLLRCFAYGLVNSNRFGHPPPLLKNTK